MLPPSHDTLGTPPRQLSGDASPRIRAHPPEAFIKGNLGQYIWPTNCYTQRMEDHASELLNAIVGLCARQLAILDLLKQTGVSESDIQDAVSRAKKRLAQVPRLAYLQTQNPSIFKVSQHC